MKRILSYIICCSLWLLAPAAALCQHEPAADQPVGEFSGWGVQVPRSNYYFIKAALAVFGNRWGAEPQTLQEFEDRTWEQLVLSYEADRRHITVDDKDLFAEVDKMLAQEKVTFDRVKDPKAYESWVREKARESHIAFENQMRHLMQLDKLRAQVVESFKAAVTEQEAFQEFLNEYNTLELQLAQFDDLDKAKEFYGKMRSARLWDAEEKKDPKAFKKPGFVSLEFLINMWKIPKEDCYKMMKLEDNAIYPPAPVWKGYAVFRVMKKRPADEKEFPRLRESYFKQVESNKKYEQLAPWLKKLKQDAGIVVYPQAVSETGTR